jgi:Na+-translocating ferredoxin:NAD+ oxidoreductase RnfD subunit
MLFTLAAFVGDPAHVAELFRVPNVNAALFFAGFMLTDPPTSPVRYRDQVVYGGIVAAASAAIYLTLGGVYFLPGGLLVGNAWEAWRRWATSRPRPAPRRR